VMDCGLQGDLLDLKVALAPCVIGYAEIGKALAPADLTALDNHPYKDWIGEYCGDFYQDFAISARAELDRMAEGITEERFKTLTKIFATASKLEANFWQMGLDMGREAEAA
jgi:thiaminase (transcriptional activator TenA)